MAPVLILVTGLGVALVFRMFWRQIIEVAIICVLVAVFVGIVTLVELTRNGFGS